MMLDAIQRQRLERRIAAVIALAIVVLAVLAYAAGRLRARTGEPPLPAPVVTAAPEAGE
ncbi:MAG: hypothetical protein JXR94_21300 [Candidatus Hydrogenedentes bacterium]|nr:hypothetical protein [Candidatus Hydrogenedentota bacterium]